MCVGQGEVNGAGSMCFCEGKPSIEAWYVEEGEA